MPVYVELDPLHHLRILLLYNGRALTINSYLTKQDI